MSNRSKYQISFADQAIVATKTTLAKAGKYGTPEYEELEKLLAKHPMFRIVEKKIRKNPNKDTHKDLTFERMEEYISFQPNSKEKLAQFEAVKKIAKTKNALYPMTKQWFLKEFQEYGKAINSEEIAVATEVLEKV